MKDKISVVIPCYRSERTIQLVVEDIIIELSNKNDDFEIILVNDGSPDNTWNRIKELHNKYPKIIKGINFTKNFGQHAATMAGFKECKGNIIVTMDDDGQTDPKQIFKLIDKLNEGYDVVIARYPTPRENVFRRFGSYINKCMSESLIGKPKEIKGSSYRALRDYVVDEIVKYDKSYPYIAGLIYRTTKNVGQVEIEHHNRIEGKSGYTLKKLTNLILNGFTAFSIKPLRISSLIGFVIAIAGFVYGLTIIIKKLVNPNIQLGYSSIMSSLLLIGGLIMIMLGIIGEYIGRIYISINNSPQYVIKEKI